MQVSKEVQLIICSLNLHLASFSLHCRIQNNKKHVQDLWQQCRATGKCYRQFFLTKIFFSFEVKTSFVCLIHSVLLLKILLSGRPQMWSANEHMLQVLYTFHYLHGS